MFFRRYIYIGNISNNKYSVYLDKKTNQIKKTKAHVTAFKPADYSGFYFLSYLILFLFELFFAIFFPIISYANNIFFPILLLEIIIYSVFIGRIFITEKHLFGGLKSGKRKLRQASSEEFEEAFETYNYQGFLLSNEFMYSRRFYTPFAPRKERSYLTKNSVSWKGYFFGYSIITLFLLFSSGIIYELVVLFIAVIIPFLTQSEVNFRFLLTHNSFRLWNGYGSLQTFPFFLFMAISPTILGTLYFLIFQNNPICWLNAINKYKNGALDLSKDQKKEEKK